MVQIPPNIAVSGGTPTSGVAASYLERVVEEYADLGWEFYRVETVGVRIDPGCLAALFGFRSVIETYYVITFRIWLGESMQQAKPGAAPDPVASHS